MLCCRDVSFLQTETSQKIGDESTYLALKCHDIGQKEKATSGMPPRRSARVYKVVYVPSNNLYDSRLFIVRAVMVRIQNPGHTTFYIFLFLTSLFQIC